MSCNELLSRLTYKITFLIPPPKKEEESHLGSLINKEKLSSDLRQEVLAVGDTSQTFGPRVRLQDLYSRRISSGTYTNNKRSFFERNLG